MSIIENFQRVNSGHTVNLGIESLGFAQCYPEFLKTSGQAQTETIFSKTNLQIESSSRKKWCWVAYSTSDMRWYKVIVELKEGEH